MKIKILQQTKEGPKPGKIFEARSTTNMFGGTIFQILDDGPFLGHIVSFHQAIVLDALPPKTINDFVAAAHQNAIDKGWYENPRPFGEVIALMHSELSEALEDYRNGKGFTEIYHEGEKPCGIPIELADTVIRIFDTCGHLGINLEAAIKEKMAYNATRPIRHGGKAI